MYHFHPMGFKTVTSSLRLGLCWCLVVTFAAAQEYASIVTSSSGLCGAIKDRSVADGATLIQSECKLLDGNQLFNFVPIGSGDLNQIKARNSGKCLGVQGAATGNRGLVVQMTCGNQPHMLWSVTGTGTNQQIKASHSNRCMNIEGGVSTDEARIIQWDCGYRNDKFQVLPAASLAYDIVSTRTGLCATIDGLSREDGVTLVQSDCTSEGFQSFNFVPVGETDVYQIRVGHTNKCLGIQGAATGNGGLVVQMACGNQPHMLWSVTGTGANQQIKATHSNRCMNIEGDVTTTGARIIQWPCGYRNDKFQVGIVETQEYVYDMVSTLSGLCGVINGNGLVQSDCKLDGNQLFTFIPFGEGDLYQVQVPQTGKCIGIEGANTGNGGLVVQMVCRNQPHMLWSVTGTIKNQQIKASHSNRCMNIEGAVSTDGARFIQWNCGYPNDKFQLRDATSRDYGIISSLSGLCGTIKGLSIDDGASLVQSDCKVKDHQMFNFVPIEQNLFQIHVQHSAKCLGIEGGATGNGGLVVQMTCEYQPHMLWSVTGIGGNRQIKASHSNLCMNIEGAVRTDGARVIQWTCGYPNDKFQIVSRGETSWEGPYTMPLVAAAAANLVDGRILTWSAYAKYGFGGSSGKTYVSIFDPATNLSTEALIEDTQHDMFCPGTAVLSDGRVMITGGSNAAAVTFYDPASNAWSKGDMMNIARGYHSMTVLSDGSVFTLGGSWSGGRGNKHGEVWSAATGDWDRKTNIQLTPGSSLLTADDGGIFRQDNHIWMLTAPNGQVFQAGPSKRMHWIDTSGEGQVTPGKLRGDDSDAMNGNAVMYDIGKILTLGGGQNYDNEDASSRAYAIDIRGGVGQETVKRVGDMSFARGFSTSVVLPSGEVVVVGGQSRIVAFGDNDSVLTAEIWDPTTEQFTKLSSMSSPRNYHSVALLLNDGRVWAACGGLCGGCQTNHADAEILTPPYMLATDGSLKTRPVIQSAPNDISPGDTFQIAMDTSDAHTFALLRLSAVTHAINNDQRRIPLTVTGRAGASFTVNVPQSYSVVPPGAYFLFALNSDGAPSLAKTVVVKQPAGPIGRTNTKLEFQIISEALSGHCVDIAGVSQDEGAMAIQWPCHGNENQWFQFEAVRQGVYRVKAKHSTKCLSVENAATTQGALVVQQTCNDQPHQLWTISGSGSNQRLKVTHTNMCLNIFGARREPGIDLIQWNCVGAINEVWKISDLLVTTGRSASTLIARSALTNEWSTLVQVQIRSEEFSGLCVDIAGASVADGAPAIQWACQEEASQLFTFQRIDDGHYYRVVAVHSSMCLAVQDASPAQGAMVIQETCRDGANHQHWYVKGSGATQQLRARHTDLCLNNYAGTSEAGNTLIQWECRGGGNELWHISDAL